MDLGELIAALEAADLGLTVPDGFRFPHSYRGYYAELAFEPARDVTVAQMLGAAREALGSTYEGWKGGDFTMTATTPCWVAVEGACGVELTAERLRDMLAAGRGRDEAAGPMSDERLAVWDSSPAASAARNVPHNPHPLCRDFQAKPKPAEFWCITCGWNRPMHDDEVTRTAIADALACLPGGAS